MSDEKYNTDKIPKGIYCYDKNGLCPCWSIRGDKPKQRNGYCSFLKRGDWEVSDLDLPSNHPIQTAQSLIWDQVKECGINMDSEGLTNE